MDGPYEDFAPDNSALGVAGAAHRWRRAVGLGWGMTQGARHAQHGVIGGVGWGGDDSSECRRRGSSSAAAAA
jgi:hypothetical protein